MTQFNETDLEAAAKAMIKHWWGSAGEELPPDSVALYMRLVEPAITAFLAGEKERGAAKEDIAHENRFSKQWVNIGHGEDEPNLFPVLIIRMEE